MEYSNLISQLLKGHPRAAARLITFVENDIEAAEEIVNSIYEHTGNAYILGITGAPGTGKSTFISTLIKIYVEQGKKIGIICVDPTSPLTGGALLGDRIRMKQLFSIDNVFIRSMANRGQLGGLARATEDVIKILDAYGCDIVIVETVGVGQSEVDIFKSAHTVVVLLVPGLGDDIQAIKSGIMEITDIFVVNKMDLPGADKKIAEIQQMLEFKKNYKYDSKEISEKFAKIEQWTPEITKVNSKIGENFDELLGLIKKHKSFLEESGVISNYLKNRITNETIQILKYKLTEKVEELLNSDKEIGKYIDQAIKKSLDPYSMANLIIKMLGLEK
ncbi:MAG: methylmalonyl Co-A mutase-associated GTPase MeaB [Promethearchaeota archaeon Loki_b32]|nr:MAG: methylmalonyl Co-A mutase-associated GTPase MeaB [Candidatus Lokiarchaeota archaeon Loki_b32]